MKKHPVYTTIMGIFIMAFVIGLVLLLKALFSLLILAAFILWLGWNKIFQPNPKPNECYIVEAVFFSLLEYYCSLQVKYPRIIAEINPTFVDKGNMWFYVIKQHPNMPVDFDILDEGRFLLQDAVNLYATNSNCVITIYSVRDEGGYIKIGACFGMIAPSQPVSTTVNTSPTEFMDEDF